MNRQTDTCQIITFPRTTYAGGNKLNTDIIPFILSGDCLCIFWGFFFVTSGDPRSQTVVDPRSQTVGDPRSQTVVDPRSQIPDSSSLVTVLNVENN